MRWSTHPSNKKWTRQHFRRLSDITRSIVGRPRRARVTPKAMVNFLNHGHSIWHAPILYFSATVGCAKASRNIGTSRLLPNSLR